MATIGDTKVTLLDRSKGFDPDGSEAAVVELLNQHNPLLDYLHFEEGNLPTGHRISQRTGLPAAYYRKMNKGVPSSKATSAQIDETAGELVARSEIDKSIAELNGNTAEYRTKEARPFIEGMNVEFMRNFFYGNTFQNGETIHGLATRFNTVNVANAANAVNVIDAGGTGSDNTSIWLLGLAPHTVYGIYPKGSKAGIEIHRGSGDEWIMDRDGGKYRGYIDEYKWQNGLALEDWRYVVRIANIDVSDLKPDLSTGADIADLMAQALEQIESLAGVTPVFVMGRRVRGMLRRQMVKRTTNSTLSIDTIAGKRVTHFDEVPVLRSDAILETEARVV